MASDQCWAIIPARGGSSGIKEKNIKNLDGLPLIAHSIKSLQGANCFNKIIVTSDSKKILSVASNFKVDVHMRENPQDSDNFTMPDIPVLSLLDSIPSGELPKFVVMVQCTAPFIKPTSYSACLKLLKSKPHDTVFAAHTAHAFLWQKNNPNELESNWVPINHPFHERLGRQFIKNEQVHETGAFYGFPVKEFMQARHRFFNHAYPIKLEEDEIVDINNHNDWDYAQFIIQNRKKENAN